MPIFQKDGKSILYIHVPKTGGSYIENLFKKNGFTMSYFDNSRDFLSLRTCSPQHYHADILKQLFNVEKFDYVFMSVRDPLKRHISEFRMRANGRKTPLDINGWTKKVIENYEENKFVYDNHIRPQSEFYISGIDVFSQDDGFNDNFVEIISKKIGFEFTVKKIDKVMHRDSIQTTKTNESKISTKTIDTLKLFYANDYKLMCG